VFFAVTQDAAVEITVQVGVVPVPHEHFALDSHTLPPVLLSHWAPAVAVSQTFVVGLHREPDVQTNDELQDAPLALDISEHKPVEDRYAMSQVTATPPEAKMHSSSSLHSIPIAFLAMQVPRVGLLQYPLRQKSLVVDVQAAPTAIPAHFSSVQTPDPHNAA